MITEFAPAKINLFLHVLGRREDGYHCLDSMVVFAGAGDELHAEADHSLTLSVEGAFGPILRQEADNLVLQAARRLADETGHPARARLRLVKQLPVASGIGGGSADAAATLRALCRLWNIVPDPGLLDRIGLSLGADVPVCLSGRPRRMGGIGEWLTEGPVVPDCGIVLINPGLAVSTPAVFKLRQGPFSALAELPAAWSRPVEMAEGLRELRNDLTEAAIALCPTIRVVLDVLEALPGCLLARMSGSGATCFGLFETPLAAHAAARLVRRPEWWCWAGGLAPSPLMAAVPGLRSCGPVGSFLPPQGDHRE